jgi:hypothetical protein
MQAALLHPPESFDLQTITTLMELSVGAPASLPTSELLAHLSSALALTQTTNVNTAVAPYTLARCAAACSRGGLHDSVLTGHMHFSLMFSHACACVMHDESLFLYLVQSLVADIVINFTIIFVFYSPSSSQYHEICRRVCVFLSRFET